MLAGFFVFEAPRRPTVTSDTALARHGAMP